MAECREHWLIGTATSNEPAMNGEVLYIYMQFGDFEWKELWRLLYFSNVLDLMLDLMLDL
jgi:hypothetical protein